MNIKDILKENGYEIITEMGMKYFELKFNKEKLEKIKANKAMYNFDLEGKFQVKISEVDFDEDGDLFIILDSLGDEHFEEGDCFDVLEVNNKC